MSHNTNSFFCMNRHVMFAPHELEQCAIPVQPISKKAVQNRRNKKMLDEINGFGKCLKRNSDRNLSYNAAIDQGICTKALTNIIQTNTSTHLETFKENVHKDTEEIPQTEAEIIAAYPRKKSIQKDIQFSLIDLGSAVTEVGLQQKRETETETVKVSEETVACESDVEHCTIQSVNNFSTTTLNEMSVASEEDVKIDNPDKNIENKVAAYLGLTVKDPEDTGDPDEGSADESDESQNKNTDANESLKEETKEIEDVSNQYTENVEDSFTDENHNACFLQKNDVIKIQSSHSQSYESHVPVKMGTFGYKLPLTISCPDTHSRDIETTGTRNKPMASNKYGLHLASSSKVDVQRSPSKGYTWNSHKRRADEHPHENYGQYNIDSVEGIPKRDRGRSCEKRCLTNFKTIRPSDVPPLDLNYLDNCSVNSGVEDDKVIDVEEGCKPSDGDLRVLPLSASEWSDASSLNSSVFTGRSFHIVYSFFEHFSSFKFRST